MCQQMGRVALRSHIALWSLGERDGNASVRGGSGISGMRVVVAGSLQVCGSLVVVGSV